MAASINDIFVSYRRKNVDFVKHVVTALEKQGKQLWVDWEDIPPGVASFTDEIERGIDSAHIFLAVLSPDYLESEHCLAELQHAARFNKRIIPIVHEKFENYPVPKAIQLINWIYFLPHAGQSNDFDSAVANLVRAIEADYEHIQEHTRLLQRATDWNRANKDAGFLLGGAALSDAETWLEAASEKEPTPAPLHTEFILASRRRQSQNQRRLLAGTTFLLAIAVIALIIAVQQFLVASRRADETLSLLIANDALNAVSVDDPVTGISRAYYANTFLDNPPEAVQSILQSIAFQPAPRYVINNALPDSPIPLPADVGTQIPITDGLYLQQDSETQMTLRDADNAVQIQFDIFTIASRDDSQIHPDVMAEIQDVQANNLSPFPSGYDFSPDGRWVVMGREGRGLIVWENTAGAPLYNTYDDHSLIIDNVQFTDDGNLLISRASEQQLVNFGRNDVEYFIWDTTDWTVVDRITAFDLAHDLAAISEDGREFIFFEYGTNDLTIWDNGNPALIWQTDTFDFVQDLAFTHDGDNLIASTVLTRQMAPPDSIRVLNPDTGEETAHYDGLDSERITGLPILPSDSSDSLRVILNEGVVSTLNFDTGDETAIGTLPDLTYLSGISENGRFVAREDFETTQFVLYDLETASEIASVPIEGWVRNVSISENGHYLAYTSENPDTGIMTLIVYDTQAESEETRFDNVSSGFVERAHLFGADGRFIYHTSDHVVHMVDTDTWQEAQQLVGFLENINDMDYKLDAQRLAVAGVNGAVTVWDTTTGAVVFGVDNIGNAAVVALTPTGDGLATGNEQGRISFWQIFSAAEALTWVEENRAILPLSCADRQRYGLDDCE